MKAYILSGNVPDLKLVSLDLGLPQIAPGEVLIETYTIDVNPVDQKTIQGKGQFVNIAHEHPRIPGWGISGIVKFVGESVKNFRPGDAVFGLINFPGHGKCYAEYVVANAGQLAHKPANISHDEAAACTLTALTAFQVLVNGNVKMGEHVFIQGAAGGVGSMAVQLAKHMGAHVVGTAKASDAPVLAPRGLDTLVDYRTDHFEDYLKDVDFAFDTMGGETLIKTIRAMKPGGRLITIPSGGDTPWREEASRCGVQASDFMVKSDGKMMNIIANKLKEGILMPNIVHRFQFDDLPLIHKQMRENKLSGKIIVTVKK